MRVRAAKEEKLFEDGMVEFKITFTTRCSAACTTCLNSSIQEHCDLDVKLFKKLIAQIIDLKIKNKILVSFYSIGESYLHPRFVECCEWAIPLLHKRGIKTCIVTNGSHMERVPEGIDNFYISFNAGRKETYENVTGMSFDRVYRNILRLYKSGEYKKAKNVQIHMLCFDENEGEERDFIELFRGLKKFKYRFSYKYDNQYENTEHKGREGKRGGGKNEGRRIPCDYITNKVTVYANGDIVICSHDFLDSESYGNLNDMSLKEILESDWRKRILENALRGVYGGICEKCNYNLVGGGNEELFVYGSFGRVDNVLFQMRQFAKKFVKKIIKRR